MVPLAGVGCPLRGPLLHGDLVAPDRRGDRLHRGRLRGEGVRVERLQGRHRTGDRGDDAGGPAPVPARRRAGRPWRLPRCRRRAARRRPRGSRRGHGHALFIGHDRSAQGCQGAAPRGAAGHPRRAVPARGRPVRRQPRHGVPVPRAALPRRAAAVLPPGAPCRRHGRGDGPLRAGGDPAADRRAPRHLRPVRADDVRAHAQAARRGALPLRRRLVAGGGARRGTVPGAGQGADDRLVGPRHPRVLRGDRGQRLLLGELGGLARAQGHGRQAVGRCAAHRRRRRRGAPGRRDRRGLLRVRGAVQLPQRPRQDEGLLPRQGLVDAG